MSEATREEIIAVACLMAQELEDIISEAEQAGCTNPFPGTRALLDDWENVFQRTELYWQKAIINGAQPSELELKLIDLGDK